MIPALSQLKNFVPSAPTLAVSLVTSIVLPIILKKCFPSMTPQKTLTFSYLATYAPLQWNSPSLVARGSQIVFNVFAAFLSTHLGYGIAEKVRGFFVDKKNPKILTQAEQTLALRHLFSSPSQALAQAPVEALGHSPAQKTTQETRYRALPDTEQIQKRKALYQTLYPLAQASGSKIPCLKDYHGYDIYLSRPGQPGQEDQDLIMTAKGPFGWTIRLASDGKYKSSFSGLAADTVAAITVKNGTEIVLEDANARWGKEYEGTEWEKVIVEFINKNGSVQHATPRQAFLDHDNALMEFLLFKQEQIAASFQKEQWNARLKFLQTNILSLFSQIRKHSPSTSPSTALTSPLAFPVSESITLGPIWSPVAASQDSVFDWTIERDAQDTIYLEFKKSASRGHMGGSSSRTLRFQQNAKGELFVDILKAHSYDVGNSSSKVSYQLQFKNDQLFFIPLNAQSESFCCFGGDVFKSAAEELPAPKQMKADFELIISSLITVGDIIRSPESIIVDLTAKQDAISFTGNPISPEQAKQLTTFDQGEGCSGGMPFTAKFLNPTKLINSL